MAEKNRIQRAFRLLGDIFNPLIPGFIIAGLSAGFSTLIMQTVPSLGENRALYLIYELLVLINRSFTPFMTAWLGWIACERFGGTAILGGMLGMLTGLAEVNSVAAVLGMEKYLFAGAGGVIAAFLGAMIVAWVEKLIRRHMPESLDIVLTPMLSIIIVLFPYVLLIMPFAGLLSQGLCWVIELLSASDTVMLKVLSGFLCAAVFLPINVAGLQHGIIALYPIQLEKYGFITLYPVFSMAGAGQVGAGFAIALMARKAGNRKLSQIAVSAAVPGMLGVAGPLLYGVVLPRPKALITACLGAGIGGAFIMCMGVVSTGWGPSGLLAIPMMAGGELTALASMGIYLAGLSMSAIAAFIFTLLVLRKKDVED